MTMTLPASEPLLGNTFGAADGWAGSASAWRLGVAVTVGEGLELMALALGADPAAKVVRMDRGAAAGQGDGNRQDRRDREGARCPDEAAAVHRNASIPVNACPTTSACTSDVPS